MSSSLVFINTLRYLTLSLGLICLACHFAQCTLLSEYQRRTEIPSWFHAGHWQYLVWYVTIGLSILSSLAVCTHATCCRRSHILRGDKCLGIVNIVPLTGSIIANTFLSGQEPWTNGIVEFKVPSKGFITFCSTLNEDTDASYPILFQRCILVDCVYVLAIMLCSAWIMLVFAAYVSAPRKVSNIAKLPNEKQANTWRISDRRQSKAPTMSAAYNHPYTCKESTSFENNYHYHPPAKRTSEANKYKTPIAPHIEKLQLPESYESSNNILQTTNLSRHHHDVPGGWVEYSSPYAVDTSPHYYHDQEGYEENPWYPKVIQSRPL